MNYSITKDAFHNKVMNSWMNQLQFNITMGENIFGTGSVKTSETKRGKCSKFYQSWNSIEKNSSDISLLFSRGLLTIALSILYYNLIIQEHEMIAGHFLLPKISSSYSWPDQEISVNDSTDKIFILTIPLDARCNDNDIKSSCSS